MKRKTTSRCFFLAAFLFAFSLAQAQTTLIIPQIVDGGAWQTTIAITNTSATQTGVSLTFFQNTSGGATSNWNLAFVEAVQPQELALPGGSTLFLHTLDTAAIPTVGWGQVSDVSGAVVAYAIFTQRAGAALGVGTAPATAAVSRILVPFDNNGPVTSMAIANPTSSSVTINVGIRTALATTQPSAITLPAQGHISFDFPTKFGAAVTAQSGLAEFYSPSGSFAILALRFQSGALTTSPVYGVTGPPIIASSGSGGSGNIIEGAFTISKTNTTSASLGPGTGSVTDLIAGDFASYSPAEFQLAYPAATFGPCSVLNATYPIGGTAPYDPDSFLDAGTIDISGPGFSSGATLMKIPSLSGPFYDYVSPTGSTLAYGGTYVISSSGGTQVGPFSNVSATLPTSFTVTNWADITSVNRAVDLPVSWSGSGFDTVTIGVTGSTQTSTTKNGASVTCVVAASLGTFSVPHAALAMLPAIAASSGATAGQLVVSAFPGTPTTNVGTSQTLTPMLVGGGQVNYGNFGPHLTVVKSVSIQ